MRIFGKQHDYYDSALAHGQDERVVYLRHREEIPYDHDVHGKFFIELDMQQTRNLKVNKEANFSSINMAFCGKIYRGVRIRVSSYGGYATTYEERVVYSYEDLLAVLKAHELEPGELCFAWQNHEKDEARITAYFGDQGRDLPLEYQIAIKAPIVAYTFGYVFRRVREVQPVIINGTLKEYEFYRVMNAYQAYQELDMFVGGVLTQNEAMTVEISDKDRIPQHGFDKYSFRKPPEK